MTGFRGGPRRENRRATHGILRRAKDELWSTIVSRANVAHGRLARKQRLRAAEIAQFEDVSARVDKQILRLNVPMADADTMEVR